MSGAASPLAGLAGHVYAHRARTALGDGPVDEAPEAARAELTRQRDPGSLEGGSHGVGKVRPRERDRDDPEQGKDRRQEPEGETPLSRARRPRIRGHGGGRPGLVRRLGDASSQFGHGAEMGGLDITCRPLVGPRRQLSESISEPSVCLVRVFLAGGGPTRISVVQCAPPSLRSPRQAREM